MDNDKERTDSKVFFHFETSFVWDYLKMFNSRQSVKYPDRHLSTKIKMGDTITFLDVRNQKSPNILQSADFSIVVDGT